MLKLKLLLICLIHWPANTAVPHGPLTDHFQNWLIANGYEADSFDRPDIGPNGSFGGKQSPSEKVNQSISQALIMQCLDYKRARYQLVNA